MALPVLKETEADMGSIGGPEILLILVVALLLFGPTKLPELGKSLGRALREFKKASQELQDTIEREVDDLKREASVMPPESTPRGTLPAPQKPAAGDPYSELPPETPPAEDAVPPPQLPFSEPPRGPEAPTTPHGETR